MVYFKNFVDKTTTIYTSQEYNAPNIGEHIMIPDDPKEYEVIGIISMANSFDKTIIVRSLSESSVLFKDYLKS